MKHSQSDKKALDIGPRPNRVLVHRFPRGVRIVSAIVWKGLFFIATTRGIYYLEKPKAKIKEVQWKE